MPRTASALEARERQRQQFLNEIKQKVVQAEDEFGKSHLHRILLLIIDRILVNGNGWVSNSDLSEIPYEVRSKIVLTLVLDITNAVEGFKRTEEEGKALFAELLTWVAQEIARPYHAALKSQETQQSKRIYGVKDRTEEIPFD